jgi:hypothetical protein
MEIVKGFDSSKLAKILIVFCFVFLGFFSFSLNVDAADTCSYGERCSDSYSGCRYCGFGGGSLNVPGYFVGGNSSAICDNSSGCWLNVECWNSSGPWRAGSYVGSMPTKVECCSNSHCPSGQTCNSSRSCVSAPTPAPGLTFSASPTNITLGNSTTLTWGATDATYCTASGDWSGSKNHAPGMRNQSITPTTEGQKTYTLTCYNAGGSTTRSVNVRVDPTVNQRPTASISQPSASTTTVTTGTNVTFTGSGSDPDGSITEYEWRFSNCQTGHPVTTGNLSTFTRAFHTGGSYTIYLRVRDNQGLWSNNCPSKTVVAVEPAIPTPPGSVTCNYNQQCTDSYSGCRYCSAPGGALSGQPGYYEGGYTSARCGNPQGCWIRVRDWQSSGPWVSPITSTLPTRVDGCGVPPPSTPTCTGYNFTVDSGQSQYTAVSSSGTDRWSAVCEDFECSGFSCNFVSTSHTQSYPATSFSGTFGSNLTFNNNSNLNRTRRCNFTVWNSSNPSNTGTCTGSVTVRPGAVVPPPACTGYNFTVDSGQSQYTAVSSSGTDRWSAVCEDFECSGFSCNFVSTSHTQSYPATSFSGTFGSNLTFNNNSNLNRTRRCNFTVWNSSNPSNTGTCTGSVTVRPGAVVPPPACTGYNFTVDSGQSQYTAVSSSGTDRWSAVCEDFECSGFSCNFVSTSHTQSYPATSFSGTFGSNLTFNNNSNLNRTRRCNFTVWNSSNPSNTGTCTGSVTVRPPGGGGIPAPSLSISANPPSITLNNSTTISYTVGNNATSCTASVTSGGGNWTGARPAFNGTHTYPGVTPTTAGTKTYTISCSNTGGTTTRSVSVTVSSPPPNQIPTATINQPTGDRIINPGQSIAFQGTGHDPDGFITNYQWRSGSCTTGILLNSSTSFSYSFPTPGTYRIYFRVRDNAGAWSSCDSRTITVASIIPENGSCGTRNTTYPSSTTNWPNTSTYCSSGTNTTSPTFPAAGTSVNWTCAGSGGGTNVNCEARRDSSIINGSCGENDKSYSTTTTWPDPNEEGFCSAGTPNPLSPTFPSVGSPTSWTCNGSGGGTTANCSAQVFPPGSPKPPSGGSWGEIKPTN